MEWFLQGNVYEDFCHSAESARSQTSFREQQVEVCQGFDPSRLPSSPRRRIVVWMEQWFLLETPTTVKDNVTVDDNVTNELEEKKDTVSSIMANIRVATNQYYA